LLYLPGKRLVVNDYGNQLLRLIDLQSGTVSTLAGGASSTQSEGPVAQVSMAGVYNMVYREKENAIYFSQPDQGTLKKIDLDKGMVSLVLNNKPEIPHPAALCEIPGGIYVADRALSGVYALNGTKGDPGLINHVADAVTNVIAMTGSGLNLYAIQTGTQSPLFRLLPVSQAVTFTSAWGDVIPDPGKYLPPFLNITTVDSIAVASDPSEERKFFFVSSYLNNVISYSDISIENPYGEAKNSSGLNDYAYPTKKSPHTFRILMAGDSHMSWYYPLPFKKAEPLDSRSISVSKRLETELNMLATLEDVPIRFEVLNLFRIGAAPLGIWPTYEMPPAVQKNDIDLVLIVENPGWVPGDYYNRPMNSEGIPVEEIDPEFTMKPALDKIPEGDAKKFYEYCKLKNSVHVEGNNLNFNSFDTEDPEIRPTLIHLYAKPLEVLQKKLSAMKTSSGESPRLILCFTPTGCYAPRSSFEKVWKEVAVSLKLPFLDLDGQMTALRFSFYPISEMGENDHFDVNGTGFFGRLLAHELVHQKLIPWNHSDEPVTEKINKKNNR
jgi:hypothetical protein